MISPCRIFHHYTVMGNLFSMYIYLSSNYRYTRKIVCSIPLCYDNHIIQITGWTKIYEKIKCRWLGDHAANMGQDMLDNEKMVFVDENEHVVIKLYFHNFSGRDLSAVESRIEWMEFSLLLKVK